MSNNLKRLRVIAEGLGELCRDVVFVGGSVAELYADDPAATDIRPTIDVLSMTIWVDKIPSNFILIMRSCAGLGTTLFVVIVGILSYRVNKQHISNRKKK